jgi:CheY-like chemotaxis protein
MICERLHKSSGLPPNFIPTGTKYCIEFRSFVKRLQPTHSGYLVRQTGVETTVLVLTSYRNRTVSEAGVRSGAIQWKLSQASSTGNDSMLATKSFSKDLVRVLVVEDDDYLRYLFYKVLNHAGFSTLQAANAEQALTSIDAVQPDIVLLDVDLPDSNGLDMLREVRAQLTGKQPTFVVVSGHEQYRFHEEVGTEFFLYKPISISMLVQLVQRIAEKHKSAL